MTITFKHYTKKIRNKTILDDINLELTTGKIYGLYGENGSGKSMLLRAISGLIYPTSGSVEINDKVITKDIDFPESLGLMIENIKLQEAFNAKLNLQILRDIKKTATDADIDWALNAIGLKADDSTKVKDFSLGMNQKLAIAQTIFEKPEIILMDEPTNALDFASIERFRKLVLELKAPNRIIIIASHNQDDLSVLSDTFLEMSEGRLSHRSEFVKRE